jgi:hypothetical protein
VTATSFCVFDATDNDDDDDDSPISGLFISVLGPDDVDDGLFGIAVDAMAEVTVVVAVDPTNAVT